MRGGGVKSEGRRSEGRRGEVRRQTPTHAKGYVHGEAG